MTNRQAVAAWLATELFGWHLTASGVWKDDKLNWQAEGNDGPSGWHPHNDWRQAGRIIEAMRELGWWIDVSDDSMCYYGSWLSADTSTNSPMTSAPAFCQWIALSAARALGYEEAEYDCCRTVR